MPSILLIAALTCLGSLALGQGALALCGARSWSWLAVPVGLALMMLVAVPAIHVPGRASTMAVILGLAILAGILNWVRNPPQRPPLAGVLAGLPVALLALVPFLASGRGGTLGVSFDNDTGAHLLLAEAYRSSAVASVWPLLPEYPLGPHALTAVLAQGTATRTDLALAGVSAAGPVLLAWTALAALRRRGLFAQVVLATTVGMPFLIASYYGEGAFKEVMEALFTLGSAVLLAGQVLPGLRWRRWIPLALIAAGAVSVYSLQGLAWPGLFLLVWLAGRAVGSGWKRSPSRAWRELRAELLPGAIGLGVLVVVLIPQIPRVEKFLSKGGVTNGIGKASLGNLVGPLSGWEALGAWASPDFRLLPANQFRAGMWTAFVLALVALGAVMLIRRGRSMLPAAALAATLVWVYSNHDQSPYVAAKALVIVSPLLILVAVLALVDRPPARSAWWTWAAPLLALVLFGRIVDSSWEALRVAKVGPTDHLRELRSLQPLLRGQRVLYLGNDDFIDWELSESHLTAAYFAGLPLVPLRPEKAFVYGQPLDFDTVSAATLNEFGWVLTTRDAAGSAAPAGLTAVRLTRFYALWRRSGQVAPRKTLAEGPAAGAVLNCATRTGRALVRAGGVAAVRPTTLEVAVPPLPPGVKVTVAFRLPAGSWTLETPYYSPLPMRVVAPGLSTTMPANLERPGPRWRVGVLTLARTTTVPVTLQLVKHWLTPAADVAVPSTLIATAATPERTVPIRQACGKVLDWYRD